MPALPRAGSAAQRISLSHTQERDHAHCDMTRRSAAQDHEKIRTREAIENEKQFSFVGQMYFNCDMTRRSAAQGARACTLMRAV